MKLSLAIAVSTLFISGAAHASDAPDFGALSCGQVTLDYNSRQRWQPGFSQFGLAFDAWTPEAFRMLKERAAECSNPDAQSFIAYMGRIEQTTLDTLAGMAAERERLAAVEESTARMRIEVEQARQEQQAAEAMKLRIQKEAEAAEQELRAIKDAKQLALAEAERARQKQRNAEEARQRETLEADRLRAERHAAEEAAERALREAANARQESVLGEARNQTEAPNDRGTQQPTAQSPAAASQLPDHTNMALDEDVKVFVRNNPSIAQNVRVMDEYELQAALVLFITQDVLILALELCDERWSDFDGYIEEAKRRSDLVRRVYLQYLGMPSEKYGEFKDKASHAAVATQTKDTLLYNLDELHRTCQQSLFELSAGLNFAQE